jgi:hypothetical protein
MIKNTVCFFVMLFATSVIYANGIPQLGAEEIAAKSVQALRALQSRLKNDIDLEIGQAKCTQDSHCKALAIGANPCGGPEGYQVYSSLESDVAQLTQLAAQYKMVRKTLHAKTGTMGACVVIPEPAVQCENQQCISIQKSDVLMF